MKSQDFTVSSEEEEEEGIIYGLRLVTIKGHEKKGGRDKEEGGV
jgi:hypothetical protein